MKHDLVVVEWKKNYPRKTIYPPKKNARKFHSKFFSACVVYYTHTQWNCQSSKWRRKGKSFHLQVQTTTKKKSSSEFQIFFYSMIDRLIIDDWKKDEIFVSFSLSLFVLIDLNFFFVAYQRFQEDDALHILLLFKCSIGWRKEKKEG
mgnify:CR=1 FL=1